MAVVMVDTDVYSYITSADERRGAPYRKHLQGHVITLSFISVGEAYAGYFKKIRKGEWPVSRIATLESGLRLLTVVPHDNEVAKTFGDIKAELEIGGIGFDKTNVNDLWIAASAKRHSLTLITHNGKHFSSIPGLNVITEAPGRKQLRK